MHESVSGMSNLPVRLAAADTVFAAHAAAVTLDSRFTIQDSRFEDAEAGWIVVLAKASKGYLWGCRLRYCPCPHRCISNCAGLG